RIPDDGVAVVAARQVETVVLERREKGRVVRRDRGGRHGQGFHASSWPRISVALPARVASEPPVPCTSASRQSGTCTATCASPRSWRTASITLVMPPRL